jgi:hypothetical protein
MSAKQTKSKASFKTRVLHDSTSFHYLNIVEKTTKSGNVEIVPESSHVSLGGAVSNKWRDGKEFFYWPEFRLASVEPGHLWSFAVDEGFINSEDVFGPIIGVEHQDGVAVPVTLYYQVSSDGGSINSVDGGGESIPVYDIELRSSSKGDILTSTPTQDGLPDAATYMAWEKQEKGAKDKTAKESAGEGLTLEDLYEYITSSQPSAAKKKKGAKGGRTTTIETLLAKLTARRKRDGDNAIFIDITDMKQNGIGARIKAPAANSIFALGKGDEYGDLFMLNRDKIASGNNTAHNFFEWLYNETPDEADASVSAALDTNRSVKTQRAKVSVASPKRRR